MLQVTNLVSSYDYNVDGVVDEILLCGMCRRRHNDAVGRCSAQFRQWTEAGGSHV